MHRLLEPLIEEVIHDYKQGAFERLSSSNHLTATLDLFLDGQTFLIPRLRDFLETEVRVCVCVCARARASSPGSTDQRVQPSEKAQMLTWFP